MTYRIRLAIALFLALASSASAKELTIERLTELPSLTGTAPLRPVWSRHSERIAFLWNDRAMPFREVFVAEATGGDPRRVTNLEGPGSGVSDLTWTPDGKALIFVVDGALFRVSSEGGEPERLTESSAARSQLAFSPDGRFLSWVEEGDFFLWNQATRERVQATKIGAPAIGVVPGARYSRLDREIVSYRWSPDSRFVALEIDDRSKVRKEPIPNYIGEETHVRTLRRDYPGDNDFVRAVEVYSVAEGTRIRPDTSDVTRSAINSYGWSSPSGPSGAGPLRLFIDQVSEDAVDRWFWLWNPEDSSSRQLWHDRRETRNSARLTSSIFRSDGGAILFTSDRSGRHHLHSLAVADGSLKQLTDGDWSVVAPAFGGPFLDVSARAGEVFFVSTQKSPYERQVYRMPESGGAATQITTLPGVHAPTLSPDGKKLALLRSDDTTPPELYVTDGAAERRLTHSPPAEFAEYDWVKARYVTFASHVDGTTIHGRLQEPRNLDRTKKYPAILGPVYSNTVRNQWPGLTGGFQQYMAERGYLVLQVDIRGSSGHGRKFREDLFLDYGGIDVEDLASGAAYLKSLPYVDPERVGIWGWSYGGLLTTMSLFKKPGVYRAGAAGAPATNVWHALTGQTENLRRPDTHPEAYRKSSAFSYAEGLKDHLMLIHGLQDDVVLFKDSVTLAEKLMMAGKNFDFVILPSATHSYGLKDYVARFVLTKVAEHFDRHLGPGPR